MQSNPAPVSEAICVPWNIAYELAQAAGALVLATDERVEFRSERERTLVAMKSLANGHYLERATPVPRPIGEDGAADGGVRDPERAVDRMIRAMAEHAGRIWDHNPIQETEREWMRPLLHAVLAATPPIPEQAPAAHRTEREGFVMKALVDAARSEDRMADIEDRNAARCDERASQGGEVANEWARYAQSNRDRAVAHREAARAILALQATPPDHVAQSEHPWPDSEPASSFVPLMGSGREPDDMRAYALELEGLYRAALRRDHGWHRIAVAMGYEPKSGTEWPPLPKWLADRVATYREHAALTPVAASGEEGR